MGKGVSRGPHLQALALESSFKEEKTSLVLQNSDKPLAIPKTLRYPASTHRHQSTTCTRNLQNLPLEAEHQVEAAMVKVTEAPVWGVFSIGNCWMYDARITLMPWGFAPQRRAIS